MKALITLATLFFLARVSAQSATEASVLAMSNDMFRFEVEGKFDSLANLFDDSLVSVSSNGAMHRKSDYLADLKAGKPVHNNIQVQEASARITKTTAIVMGKGVFTVTANGAKATYHLSYMEVFIKKGRAWQMVALHTGRLAI